MTRGPLHPEMRPEEVFSLASQYERRIMQARLTLIGALGSLIKNDVLDLNTRIQLALAQLQLPEAATVNAAPE